MAEVFEFFEEKLMEEVRRCRYLYDAKMRLHSDREAVANAWQEIAKTLSSDTESCKRRWKQLRDRYVRARKKVKGELSGDVESMVAVPGIIRRLSWLSDFIKHRTPDTSFLETVSESEEKPVGNRKSEVASPSVSPAGSPVTPVSASSWGYQLPQCWESPGPTPPSLPPNKRKRMQPAEAVFNSLGQPQNPNMDPQAISSYENGHYISPLLSEFCQSDSRALKRSFEEKLIEEVRGRRHLYDRTMQLHSDREAVEKAWREIAANLSSDAESCKKGWKQVRDRYVRARKRVRSAEAAAVLRVPGIFCRLNWLSDYIKHRPDSTCFPEEVSESEEKPVGNCKAEVASPSVSPAGSPVTPVSASSWGYQLPQCWESPGPTPPSLPPNKRKRMQPAEAVFNSLGQMMVEAAEAGGTISDENAIFGHYVSCMLSTLSPKHSRLLRMRMHQVMFDFMESVK
ncbi:hypothetical protein MATL_G00055570 [Megalops atlanticus]|uniref:MADF domain-containing protein n=1 Tax=Megalops atlanticus TaxID=7932 RepID=A0A9D3QCJ0_MEGAT|nr:hypothetical protein MATL_G00055570 [Megalops atlanticus]